jgi:hypothetical protein
MRLVEPGNSFIAETGSFSFISGSMTQVGDYTQTGDYVMVGDKTITGSLSVSSNFIVSSTLVNDGALALTNGSNLTIGTGSLLIVSSSQFVSGSVTITGSLNVSGSQTFVGNSTISGSLTLSSGSALNINNGLYVNGNRQYNYGQFYDTTTQSGSADTAYPMKFNTTDISMGVSVANETQIKVDNTGIYNLQFSAQLEQTTNGASDICIWLRKDGVNVANSNTELTIEKVAGGGKLVAAWNYMIELNANQYVELVWSSNSANTNIHYHTTQSTPTRPATPSVIVTVTQIA